MTEAQPVTVNQQDDKDMTDVAKRMMQQD